MVFVLRNLDIGMFLRRNNFFIIIEKKLNKSSSQINVYSNLTVV